jgi:type IV pilus assembly protein PilW
MSNRHFARLVSYRRAAGLTLVEMMIALVLGLMVVGVAIGIFFSNRQTYRATETLGRVQENARTAFELMARDVREAAGNPCVNNLPIANVLTGAASNWWTNIPSWDAGIVGYEDDVSFPSTSFGTGNAQRLSGTDAIQLISGDDSVATISGHNTAGFQFTLNTANHGYSTGDIMMACNSRQASIFQASAVSGNTVSHAAGGGNCTGALGVPVTCGATPVFEFSAPNSVMVRLHSTRWYLGNNTRGTRSLWQSRLEGSAVSTQEIADGVEDMQITYLMRNGTEYVDAEDVNAVANGWANVIATRIQLTLQGDPVVGSGTATRQMIQIASLRNRNQ